MSPHVFLDIDGVLTTEDTWEAWYEAGQPRNLAALFDPACVAFVQALCARSGAQVVISSSWRRVHGWDELMTVLREVGLTAPVVGATPVYEDRTRGAEIAAYVEQHGIDRERMLILRTRRT